MEENSGQKWTMEVKSKTEWFDLNLKEVWQYKDLVYMMVTRDFISQFKQTILGPMWYIFQPLITTIVYSIVFGSIAKISTDEIPHTLFYMSGLLFWNMFASNLIRNSDTFSANQTIFGKVYFPRLVVPISTTISCLVSFLIQLFLLLMMYVYFSFRGVNLHSNSSILLFPYLIVLVLLMSMALGIITTSITTKYKDVKFLIGFVIQLSMWATPIIYPSSSVTNSNLKKIIEINPMAPIIETFRYSLFGLGRIHWNGLAYSTIFCFVTVFIGMIAFNKVEKDFMDTV